MGTQAVVVSGVLVALVLALVGVATRKTELCWVALFLAVGCWAGGALV